MRRLMVPLSLFVSMLVLMGAVAIGLVILVMRQSYCEAQIRVFEDGSWMGESLTYNNRVLDKHWDKNMTLWQFPPQVGKTRCVVTTHKS